jgi:putative transposase
MIVSRKYRIYPNKIQKAVIDNHFHAVRKIFNVALETKNIAYYDYGVSLSRYDLQKQMKDCKDEFMWLKEVNSQSLQGCLMHLDASFTNYFRGLKDGSIAKRKATYIEKRNSQGLKINWSKYYDIGKPKFRSKKDNIQSFLIPQNFCLQEDKLFIPKLKTGIKTIIHQECVGVLRNVTISKTATGKYFVSICLEDGLIAEKLKPIKEETTIGIDLGIKTFAVCSDGQEFKNPKHLKNAIERLKVIQKRLSKKVKNSKNRDKQRIIIAKLHEKIANKRKDFLHKTSSAITKQYDTIVVEDLAIKNMVKNHKLAQSISDAGWGNFTLMLKYKCAKKGKNHIEIDRYFPSSKTHFDCGYVNNNLTLNDRTWTCPNCKKEVLRDLNASINIKHSGLGQSVEPVELPTLVGALKQEASIPLGYRQFTSVNYGIRRKNYGVH